MSIQTVNGIVCQSAGPSATWNATTKIIPAGMICWETDTGYAKITDGETVYASLPYWIGSAAGKMVGTGAGNVIVLDGQGRLPAVDGSQLLNTYSKFAYNKVVTNATAAQDKNLYVIPSGQANVLSLLGSTGNPGTPVKDMMIQYMNLSGLLTNTIDPGTYPINGVSGVMTVNDTGSFVLRYSGDGTIGWMILNG